MKKIALIGASGFVGTWLIDKIKNDIEIVNLDKVISSSYSDISIQGDVRNLEFLKENLKGIDTVVLLAAEHRDDVSPVSLYYDVNVVGTKNVLDAMDFNGVNNIIFTSSVAVYGLNKVNPDENHVIDPFNDYGKSKWQAEVVLNDWFKSKSNQDFSLNIIRPTVIFGERNRGNVYNLLKQIASGKFLMIGKGNNRKSMAYIGNIVAFIEYLLHNNSKGKFIYNYVDKPDFTMTELVGQVEESLKIEIPSFRIPYSFGMLAGFGFDFLAFITRKKLSVSSVRVKKFCATTQFDASKVHSNGFKAPFTLEKGLDRTLKSEFSK